MLRSASVPRATWLVFALSLAPLAQAEQVRDPKGAYSLEAPQGWVTKVGDGTAMVAHPSNGAGLMIVVSAKVLDDLGLFANTVLNSLKSQTPDRKETGRQKTQLCGFDALLVRSQRTMGETLMRDEMHVLFTPTRQFCLITQRPATLDAREGEAPLKAMLASLTIEGKANKAVAAKPLINPLWGTPFGPAVPAAEPAPQPKTPDAPFKMKALRDPNGVWAVNVPADWTPQKGGNQANQTMVSSPDEHANVVLYAEPWNKTSVEEYFKAMIPELQKRVPNWRLIGKQPINVAGRDGLHARAESVTQGVNMHGDLILVHNGRHFVMLSCNCPKGEFPQYQLKFGHVIASLRFCADAPAEEPDERNLLNPPLR